MIVDFNDGESASIKSFVVKKKKKEIKATTKFMSGKSLTFAKLSLKSFIYALAETLYFPNEIAKEIYKRIICYHILTDTESTSLLFIVISDAASNYEESKT